MSLPANAPPVTFVLTADRSAFVVAQGNVGKLWRFDLASSEATLVATGALTLTQAARAAGETVGVSWSNFQEERWKTDEAAIKAALERAGVDPGAVLL